MTPYEYTGRSEFYLNGGDEVLTPGDHVEFEDGPPEHFKDKFRQLPQDAAEEDSSEGDDESPSEDDESPENDSEEAQSEEEGEDVSPPFDPADLNVEEIEAELEDGDFSEEELDALYEAEEDGEDRSTAKDAIADAKHE